MFFLAACTEDRPGGLDGHPCADARYQRRLRSGTTVCCHSGTMKLYRRTGKCKCKISRTVTLVEHISPGPQVMGNIECKTDRRPASQENARRFHRGRRPSSQQNREESSLEDFRKQALDKHNRLRARHGSPPLQLR
ncbi:hypothetical protein ElyMa_000351700 [Elysia marginata]|uniref:Uncharacterized protein n=1 Tax=Elysia marginata TaxID=1093978 RepID=A0AAV4FFA1_9GAST|nr:hypothetical protein ElyMa_000351700 [Elysia marginata]